MDKLAVLRANAIGDYVLSLPALDALKATYPDAELVLIGAPWHDRFLTGRAGPVDRVMVVPPLPGVRAAEPGERPDASAFLAKVRAERFDLAVQLQDGGQRTNPLVAAFEAGLTVGLRATDAIPLDRWTRYVQRQPEVHRCLDAVGLVGAAPRTFQPRIEPSPDDVEEAQRVAGTARRLRVALHPGAPDPRRRWPAERFAAVGEAAAAIGAEVFVTGTHIEKPIVDAVVDGMSRPARPVVGSVSVGGLAALYAQCAVVVAGDTGPLHLARAVGSATVGLFWAGDLVNAGGPDRRRHRPLPSWTSGSPERDDSLVADIPVEAVLNELHDLLA